MMEFGSVASWAIVGISLLSLAISIVGASRRGWDDRIKAGAIEQARQQAKIDLLEDRLIAIERDVQHLPDKDVAHRMEMAISRLEGRFEAMDERLKPVAAMASRMQDYVLQQKG